MSHETDCPRYGWAEERALARHCNCRARSNTQNDEAMHTLALLARTGDRVRLGYTVNGRTHKSDPMSADEAIYAARTVVNLGGTVTTVFRSETGDWS